MHEMPYKDMMKPIGCGGTLITGLRGESGAAAVQSPNGGWHVEREAPCIAVRRKAPSGRCYLVWVRRGSGRCSKLTGSAPVRDGSKQGVCISIAALACAC